MPNAIDTLNSTYITALNYYIILTILVLSKPSIPVFILKMHYKAQDIAWYKV